MQLEGLDQVFPDEHWELVPIREMLAPLISQQQGPAPSPEQPEAGMWLQLWLLFRPKKNFITLKRKKKKFRIPARMVSLPTPYMLRLLDMLDALGVLEKLDGS